MIGMKTDLFQSRGNSWVFQICWHIECSTFTASSFRIWNSSAGIPSPPLALFIVMLPKVTWLYIPGCLALGEWSYHCDYVGHEDLFLYSSSVYSCPLFLIFSLSIRIDWFDLLAVQGTFKSLLQHHCSKALILQYSAFFIVSDGVIRMGPSRRG